MIEHNRDQWAADDRERRWMVHFLGGTGAADTTVLVRQYAVLAPGEELSEYPPTVEMTWAEWESHHADYGLTIEGTPLSA